MPPLSLLHPCAPLSKRYSDVDFRLHIKIWRNAPIRFSPQRWTPHSATEHHLILAAATFFSSFATWNPHMYAYPDPPANRITHCEWMRIWKPKTMDARIGNKINLTHCDLVDSFAAWTLRQAVPRCAVLAPSPPHRTGACLSKDNCMNTFAYFSSTFGWLPDMTCIIPASVSVSVTCEHRISIARQWRWAWASLGWHHIHTFEHLSRAHTAPAPAHSIIHVLNYTAVTSFALMLNIV